MVYSVKLGSYLSSIGVASQNSSFSRMRDARFHASSGEWVFYEERLHEYQISSGKCSHQNPGLLERMQETACWIKKEL